MRRRLRRAAEEIARPSARAVPCVAGRRGRPVWRAAGVMPMLALLLMGQGAPGDLPRPRCDLGAGFAGLAEAERLAGQRIASLSEGRALGEALLAQLNPLPGRFAGCGCAQVAGLLHNALEAAGPAASEATAARIAAALEQARFRLRLARQGFSAMGCR